MTRKKVKLNWIANDSARKASLKKRKVGLLKKVSELTTLCDVNAFIIIYSPDESEPAMWPSRPVVEQLLARFNNMPEMEKSKKMMNQETYLKERVVKSQDQLKKNSRKNKVMEVSNLMEQFHLGKKTDDFNINELQGLVWLMEERKKDLRKRMDYYEQINPPPQESLPPPPHPPQLPAPEDSTAGVGGSTGGGGRNLTESAQWDQWFIDMMKNSENIAGSSSGRTKSDAGSASHQAFAASSGAANQMGLPHGNPRAYNIGSDLGLPHANPRAYNIGLDLGLPHVNPRAYNIGSDLGLPHANPRAYHIGSDLELPHANPRAYDVGSDLELPHANPRAYDVGSDLGLPHGSPRAYNIGSDLGLPCGNPRAYNIGSGLGLPQGNINIGSSSGLGGNDVNLGLPQENTGVASNAASSDMGLSSELFGGNITGSDVGMPYDVTKQWPHNFYP
ncbi:MADS-box domain-containing protein [Citrus sinensis]|uniref:MADS-box domain-containing protein n=1 Tax=Citrus sinensis TaxID=2711 RepID=A0ACB8JYG3_CITSI|nr:MADS-box domain-containing protein [Citrus sinensis]